MRDIENSGRSSAEVADARLAIDRAVFADLCRSTSLEDSLAIICRLLEQQAPGLLCSVLLLDHDGTRLHHAAAPGLPESFRRAIDGRAIGPNAGSCGTSAYLRRPVFVSDIANDPLCADYGELALQH